MVWITSISVIRLLTFRFSRQMPSRLGHVRTTRISVLRPCSYSCWLLLPERILPALLFLASFAQKRGQCAKVQEALVQPVKRLIQGPRKIDEQDHAIALGVIPNFMVERVIKDEGFALAPG